MPELPEVETVRSGLQKALAGRVIDKIELRREALRVPITPGFARAVSGQRIVAIRRRAKYLLMELEGGSTILLHLGMSGRLLVKQGRITAFEKHDHVAMALGNVTLIFNDPRRFGLMLLLREGEERTHTLLVHLGAEPLDEVFDARYLQRRLKGKKQSVKVAIMDRNVVVGVGNIYASEALFACGVRPTRKAGSLSLRALETLVPAIKSVLRAAIQSGGSTLRDYVRSDGDVGYFQHYFKVYGQDKKPCVVCKKSIRKIIQGGRSTYFCPHCQA